VRRKGELQSALPGAFPSVWRFAACIAAVAKHPKRNILLQPGARVIKKHEGESKPETPTDPNPKSW
jgi:hypothetical protein